jgi:SynChlorMet cassette radical SAM/SPASM protein ScmF
MPRADAFPLRRIYLYLSGSCNLACRHCWIDPRAEASADAHLPLAAIKGIVDEARQLGLSSVKITGGEPLLHPQVLELVAFLHESNLAITMETNATRLGPAEARALAQANAQVSVSLDGTRASVHEALRRTPGCFGEALAGARALRAAGIRFQVISCLHRANRDDLMRMPEFARELGAFSLKVNPISALSRSTAMLAAGELPDVAEVIDTGRRLRPLAHQQDIELVFDVPPVFADLANLRRRGIQTCGILSILGVLHNGHASMCGIGQVLPELDMGDLTRLGVRAVWEGAELLQSLRANVPQGLGGVCGRCMLKSYCLGKCLAHDYAERGTMFGGHAFCEQALAAGLFPASRLLPAQAVTVGTAQ